MTHRCSRRIPYILHLVILTFRNMARKRRSWHSSATQRHQGCSNLILILLLPPSRRRRMSLPSPAMTLMTVPLPLPLPLSLILTLTLTWTWQLPGGLLLRG